MTVLCDNCSPRNQCAADKNRTECRFYQPITKDEWRKTCSTEEFAEFLSDVVFNAIVDYRIDKNNCEKEDGNYWLKWLKQPHTKGGEL